MANILDTLELDGIREDFLELLGIYEEGDDGGGSPSIARAKTLVSISRITNPGTFNESTGVFDTPTTSVIYTGPAHVSPVTYRRDRQEIGGGEAVRIRQYRAIVPWDSGDIHLGDIFLVNFTEDPELDGRSFDVSDVLYESELAVRRITLTDTAKDIDPNC